MFCRCACWASIGRRGGARFGARFRIARGECGVFSFSMGGDFFFFSSRGGARRDVGMWGGGGGGDRAGSRRGRAPGLSRVRWRYERSLRRNADVLVSTPERVLPAIPVRHSPRQGTGDSG